MNLCQDSIESKNELLKAQHEQEFLESLNQIKTAKHHDENTDGFVEINHEGHGFTNRITNLNQSVCWYIFEWLLKGGVTVPYIVVNLGKGFQQSTSQVAPTQTTNLQGEFSLPA